MDAQPSWFSRNWKWLVGLGCVLPTLCCGASMAAAMVFGDDAVKGAVKFDQPVSARVDCGTPGPGGVDCVVKRTEGAGGLTACWKLAITCTNGAVMNGDACGSLGSAQAEATVNMPVAKFDNQAACDAPASGAVKDLAVEAN